ncbi:hypothetical protein O181_014516 [Austropuccinia psidii MF-1]|uniref:DNA polymerase n=1 Tax=Austropuccinia psidii MF-1 TaxID=1389203 RepID=A0A9Q3C1V7_9BASI|nr:hypothetical protein [Austropuccinia psidii MF-1]
MAEQVTDGNVKPAIRFCFTQLDTFNISPEETSSFALRTSPFLPRGHLLYKVPVVRIFGSTPAGQRVLAHVHGAMPYFYAQYEASLNPDFVHNFIRRLGASLNYATAASLGRLKSNDPTQATKHQFVGYIALCKGVPFYGFHVGYRYFLKIYCLQAKFKKRMAELLRGGKVMNPLGSKRTGPNSVAQSPGFKIFEEHIPFHLQFMLDYNLYGCGWVELSECLFRRPLPDSYVTTEVNEKVYLASNVSDSQLGPADLNKSSYCQLELDCHVSSIVNRKSVKERKLHHSFVELLEDPIPANEKLVQSVKALWADERKRRQERGQKGPEERHESEPITQRDYAVGDQPQWFMEPTFRDQIHQLLGIKHPTSASCPASELRTSREKFAQFVKPESALSKFIPTAFQAIEAIHVNQWIKDEQEDNPYGVWAIHGIGISLATKSVGDDYSKERISAESFDDGEMQLEIDIAAIKSQMENYKDDVPEDENELAQNQVIHTSEEEEIEGLDWDEIEAPDEAVGLNETHAKESNLSAPTGKDKSEALSTHQHSPGISPSRKQQHLLPLSQSPTKRQCLYPPHEQSCKRVEFKSLNTSPAHLRVPSSSALKREREEQDDGFHEPKAGKIMNFVERTSRKAGTDFGLPDGNPTTKLSLRASISNASGKTELSLLQNTPFAGAPGSEGSRSRLVSPNANPLQLNDMTLNNYSSNQPAQTLHMSQSSQSQMNSPSIDTKMNLQSIHTGLSSQSASLIYETESPSKSCALSSRSSSQDEARKRLDLTILTQTQQPKPFRPSVKWYRFNAPSPSTNDLIKSLTEYDLPLKVYTDPFYSDPADVPERKREYAGRQYTILGNTLRYIPEFDHVIKRFMSDYVMSHKSILDIRRWEFAIPPPKLSELKKTVAPPSTSSKQPGQFLMVSQIEGPTQSNEGFKYTQIKSNSTAQGTQHMDVLAIEVHADSRNGLRPDPVGDEIQALFYCLQTERENVKYSSLKAGVLSGVIVVDEKLDNSRFSEQLASRKYALGQCYVEVVDSELSLLNSLIDKVRGWDPEVLAGYELENWSWGYVMQRGRELAFDMVYELSRVKTESYGRFAGKDDKWGSNYGSSIKVTGRHVLSIWRIIRSEIALTQYTFENVVYHVLRTRIPHYSFSTLAKWWRRDSPESKRKVLLHYLGRVEFDIQLVDETEMISRNAEISRTLGVDFFSAISRGSQFKVESVMFRIAKPESYLLPSPSREEVAQQNAAECIPLVMEPQSAFYKSPLLVLDFQSLYPSIMIAYNYCYSTCLGRINPFKGTNKLGISTLELPRGLLELMKDQLIVSPNGLMFVKQEVRKSLLGKMLNEILETRVMIKQSMKFVNDDKALTKMLNARQLGLKFIANVTYGYTSASFSGRMPCVEIADAIVQTGRETLEKSMEFIHSVKEWDAKVVYGDTDSLFVYLPGRTKADAFRIGNEIAEAITKQNPAPVRLKFEKVFLPSVLMAKKRYVGAKYESLTDSKPVFDAKGIEVIRRDGIPALQKIQETCLKKLFETQDLSNIKAYLYRQWQRLLLGKVSVQDFTFAKEVKLGTYSEKGHPPPGALIAARNMAIDPRNEPVYAERVPYVIIKGAPQSKLRDRAVSPELLLKSRVLELDAEYYITRVFIPSLARIFNLVGVDVASWYQSMPKMLRATKSMRAKESHSSHNKSQVPNDNIEENQKAMFDLTDTTLTKANKHLVDEHFQSDRCLNCEEDGQQGILCQSCTSKPTQVSYSLLTRARTFDKRRADLEMICRACSFIPALEQTECDSLDCPILYQRIKARWLTQDTNRLITAVDQIDKGVNLSLISKLDW